MPFVMLRFAGRDTTVNMRCIWISVQPQGAGCLREGRSLSGTVLSSLPTIYPIPPYSCGVFYLLCTRLPETASWKRKSLPI